MSSGATSQREGVEAALEFAQQGDRLVWKLDRLRRSLKDLIDRVNDVQARGIGFKCVQENVDTTTADGVLFFHIFGSKSAVRTRTHP
jgi:DNA invertase Pin-like site-specific DNA recombinase